MESLRALLAIDHRRALEFFASGLRDVCDTEVNEQELLYNASVLAHYAQVSTQTPIELPTPSSLVDVFDHFVCGTVLYHDSEMMEIAGTQCLLLSGFFETQMRGRHNIRWYSELGAGYFSRAAAGAKSTPKSRLLETMARRFEQWRQRHSRLGRELRDQSYILDGGSGPSRSV